jgi:hypothetical protein
MQCDGIRTCMATAALHTALCGVTHVGSPFAEWRPGLSRKGDFGHVGSHIGLAFPHP